MASHVVLESALEAPIYEDGISNRQRRSLRAKSRGQRLSEARTAQAESGVRIRIARPVKNQTDFNEELKIWIPHVQERMARRKSLGNLAMTVFDTAQQPLRSSEGQTQESIEGMLEVRAPSIFRDSTPIEVTGTALFGNRSEPFIGLTLARTGFAHDEREAVRGLIAPELLLENDHQRDHTLHVSLGQALSYERALDIQKGLEPVLPVYVQFLPATVAVDLEML